MSENSNSEPQVLLSRGMRQDRPWPGGVPWQPVLWATLLFSVVIRVFWREWVLSGQYEYGALALPAVGLLLFRVWQDHPETGEVSSGWAKLWPWLGSFTAVGIGFGYFVYLANPNWRFIFWLIALLTALLGSLAAACAGGVRWAWRFAPAWLPLLAAVPWPTRLESTVADLAMRWVAHTAAVVLQLSGHAAVAIGNTIHLTEGVLGVAEACSGMQSFQLSLFASLLLGEFFSLRPARRVVLVCAGLALAVTLNIARVLSLAAVFIADGDSAMDFFHDEIGAAAMVLTLLAIWMTASVLDSGNKRVARRKRVGIGEGTAQLAYRSMATWGILLIGCVAASHVFYLLKERNAPTNPVGTLDPDRIPSGYAKQTIPYFLTNELRYSEGYMWRRIHTNGRSEMAVFYLSWRAGEISSFIAVHRPDVCLPSVGVQQVGEAATFTYLSKREAKPYAFDGYRFSSSGMPLVVFRQVFDSRAGELPRPALTGLERIGAAFRGERIKRRSMIQFVAVNEPDARQAWLQAVAVLDAAFLVDGGSDP